MKKILNFILALLAVLCAIWVAVFGFTGLLIITIGILPLIGLGYLDYRYFSKNEENTRIIDFLWIIAEKILDLFKIFRH